MSYNGSGVFVINTSGQPVVTGTVISSTAFNALTADLGTGLSTAITKDGQTATTARIPFAAGISSTLITDSSSTTTGSIITAGGAGVAKALFVGTTANVAGAVTLQSTLAVGGVATYSAQPIFSSLTASSAVATDASKGLVSVTNTGTGNNVLATSPTLVTPILGAATATSINKVALTAPATSATLTIANGASLVTAGAYSLTLTATAATNVTLPTSGTLLSNATTTGFPAGSVLQVVSTAKTDAFSTTSTSMVDVTGLSVAITPTSATSKILVQLTCTSMGSRTGVVTMYTQIVRNSTTIFDPGNGWASPAVDQCTGLVGTFLDSPATTSATTYKLQIKGDGAIVGINRTAANATVVGNSSITVMEIAA